MSNNTVKIWLGEEHQWLADGDQTAEQMGREAVGRRGFVTYTRKPAGRGRGATEVYELRDHPPNANLSGAPIPVGWTGTTNDVSTHGCGTGEVVDFEVTKSHLGRRVAWGIVQLDQLDGGAA